jgi:hypothetical protein
MTAKYARLIAVIALLVTHTTIVIADDTQSGLSAPAGTATALSGPKAVAAFAQPGLTPWRLISSGPVALAPQLEETVWNAAVAPFGPFDFIGLHRLRSPQVTPNRKVILFLPGATANGNLYTTDENHDFRIYLANRGYDVYSLDYRTHFIPLLGLGPDLQPLDLRSLNNWNSARFVDDVGLAVDQARAVSGVPKLYLAAFSSGNEFMYFYATKFGNDKLRGLIGMDGGPWQAGSVQPPNTVNFSAGEHALRRGDTPANRALLESYNVSPGAGVQFAAGNLLPDISTPLPSKAINDPLTYFLQNVWGYGQLTNIENGYNSLEQLVPFMVLATDDFWPNIQALEDVTLSNWSGRPPGLHYLDRFSRVDLPMILFSAQMLNSFDYTRLEWKFLAATMTRTRDAETHPLNGFGHLDVLTGTYARAQVFVPIENWLQRH